ncbi:MAG TPA: DUF5680 domain-containing protein [Candidatus Pacearchaeota archaeon]|nr:DUF5680 domain-containing protein [Candidatus Pacearchaeota archaeon]
MFEEFLLKAKINTYASNGENEEKILEDGSKELVYKNNEWEYRDRYFGFNPFIGEEIIFKDSKIFWGMNYYGRIISDKVETEQIYQFLKKSLRLAKIEYPFRGPIDFQENNWIYKNKINGIANNFTGKESIYFKQEKVYELIYHGGIIK